MGCCESICACFNYIWKAIKCCFIRCVWNYLCCGCCGICKVPKRKGYEEICKAGAHNKDYLQVSVVYSNHQEELRAFSDQLQLRCHITIKECKTVQEALELQLPLLLMFRRKSDRPVADLREALENVADKVYPAIRLIYVHNYRMGHIPVIDTSSKVSDTPFSKLKGIFDFAFIENKMYDCELNAISLVGVAKSLNKT